MAKGNIIKRLLGRFGFTGWGDRERAIIAPQADRDGDYFKRDVYEADTIGYVNTAINAVVNTIKMQAETPIYYALNDPTREVEAPPELEEVLSKLHYSRSWLDIIGMMVRSLVLSGDFYIVPTKDEDEYSYLPLSPDTSDIDIYSDSLIKPDYYIVKKGNKTFKLAPDEIWHFKIGEGDYLYKGCGILEKSQSLIDLLYYGLDRSIKLFRNDGKPAMIILDSRSGDDTTTEQRKRAIYEVMRTGSVAYLPEKSRKSLDGKMVNVEDGFSVKDLKQMSSKDMMADSLFDMVRKAIYDLLGYYEITDGTNRASSYIKRTKFYEMTINPLIKVLNTQITEYITKEYGVRYCIPSCMIADKESMLQGFRYGACTPNEIRDILGLQRIDKEEMDTSYIEQSLLPIDHELSDEGLGESPEEPEEPEEDTEEEPEEETEEP